MNGQWTCIDFNPNSYMENIEYIESTCNVYVYVDADGQSRKKRCSSETLTPSHSQPISQPCCILLLSVSILMNALFTFTAKSLLLMDVQG